MRRLGFRILGPMLSRERLIDELWPEHDAEAAQTLRVSIAPAHGVSGDAEREERLIARQGISCSSTL